MNRRAVLWLLCAMLWILGIPLTFLIGFPEHNEGAIWEGGLFMGMGMGAFFAALTYKPTDELLQEVANSGVSMEDKCISYVEVQINRRTWEDIQNWASRNL